jgi:hypothetical protein
MLYELCHASDVEPKEKKVMQKIYLMYLAHLCF